MGEDGLDVPFPAPFLRECVVQVHFEGFRVDDCPHRDDSDVAAAGDDHLVSAQKGFSLNYPESNATMSEGVRELPQRILDDSGNITTAVSVILELDGC